MLKKVTKKNADGSSLIYEFDVPKMQGVPEHPGQPKGPDTVPAWLTPGEFVVNAEATRMFEPQIEAMNDIGRAVQRKQGGTIPEYHNDGGVIGEGESYTRRAHDYVPFSTNSPLMNLIASAVAPSKEEVVPDGYTGASVTEPQANMLDEVSQPLIDTSIPNFPDSFEDDVPVDANSNSESTENKDPWWWRSLQATTPTPDTLEAIKDFASNESALNQAQRSTDLSPFNEVVTKDFMTPEEAKAAREAGLNPGVSSESTMISTLPEADEVEKPAPTPEINSDALTQEQKDAMTPDTRAVVEGDQNKKDELLNYMDNLMSTTSEPSDVSNDKIFKVINELGVQKGDEVEKQNPGFFQRIIDGFKKAGEKLLSEDELYASAVMYLGSRALGSSHAGAINFAGKYYINGITARQQREQAALVAKQKRIDDLEDYRKKKEIDKQVEQGSFTKGTAKTRAILQSRGVNLNKDTTSMVRVRPGAGPMQTEVYKGTNGLFYVDDGKVFELDKNIYEEYSDGQHSMENLRNTAKQATNSSIQPYNQSITEVDEDGRKISTTLKPIDTTYFSNAIIQHFEKLPQGRYYVNTPEGQRHMADLARSLVAYQKKNNKNVENLEGFFAARNADIIGVDGRGMVESLVLQDDGKTPIDTSHYKDLGSIPQELVGKIDFGEDEGNATTGQVYQIAINAFNNPENAFEIELKDKVIKAETPKGSSKKLEFVKQYLKHVHKNM